MHFPTIFTAALFSSAIYAEDHPVAVGSKSGDLVFQPDSIQAAEGDTVTFRFWPKNHSVAQAAFNSPCQPLTNGFWSGFVPTTSTTAVANWTFTYEVTNASAPIWFYCTQGQHCQDGMVGVINPPYGPPHYLLRRELTNTNPSESGPRTLTAFKRDAEAASDNVSPSSTAGSGGNLTQSGSDSSTSGQPASPSSSNGAASQLTGGATFAGLAGLFTFFLL